MQMSSNRVYRILICQQQQEHLDVLLAELSISPSSIHCRAYKFLRVIVVVVVGNSSVWEVQLAAHDQRARRRTGTRWFVH